MLSAWLPSLAKLQFSIAFSRDHFGASMLRWRAIARIWKMTIECMTAVARFATAVIKRTGSLAQKVMLHHECRTAAKRQMATFRHGRDDPKSRHLFSIEPKARVTLGVTSGRWQSGPSLIARSRSD